MKNVLVIYLDQADKDVFSCYGGKEVSTPHIDGLARRGALCRNFYTPSAVCTPSRGCFLTGLYPFGHGAYRNGLPVRENACGMASIFSNYGYDTAYIGKWHLGNNREMGDSLESDNLLGFSFPTGKRELGHAKSISPDGSTYHRTIVENAAYTSDWIADEASKYIKDRGIGRPFFLMCSFPDPHQPFCVRDPYATMFNPCRMTVPESFNEKVLPDWAENDAWGRNHYFPHGMFERTGGFQRMKAQYLGEIKCIDDCVGRILRLLEDEGLLDDTVVILTADHGEYLGRHGLMEKNNLYDNVYSVPFILSGQGIVEYGQIVDDWICAVDFPRTLFGLLGLNARGFVSDGQDLSDSFIPHDEVREKPIFIYPTDVPRAGIITSKYKLAFVGRSFDGNSEFHDHILFDLKKDPEEMDNCFTDPAYASIIPKLAREILHHLLQHDVPPALLPEALFQYGGRPD